MIWVVSSGVAPASLLPIPRFQRKSSDLQEDQDYVFRDAILRGAARALIFRN